MRPSAIVLTLAGLLGGLLGACTVASAYACTSDSQCVSAGGQGTCEASGYCAFPDAACPSGKRYGEYGEGGLGGSCVDGESTGASVTASSTSTASGSSGDPTTDGTTSATGPVCAELGGACDDASDCCNPCMACAGNVCVADVGAAGECGECQACDENAACAPAAPGSECQFECGNLVYGDGEADGVYTCYAYPSALVPGTCGGDGRCAFVDQKACGDTPGAPIVSCDSACSIAGMGSCPSGAPASSIALADLCALNTETNQCGPGCEGDGVVSRACDAVGACVVSESIECAPYTCNGGECLLSCNNSMDCADGFSCMSKVCG